MPELPEVETVRRSLEALITGKTIRSVTVNLPRIIRTPDDVNHFKTLLVGLKVHEVRRRGKFLLIDLDPYLLVSHLRMEGRYGLYATTDSVEKHTHVILHFDDDTELRYKDVRQFGTMDVLPKQQIGSFTPLLGMGPEPLEDTFTPKVLRELVDGRNRSIKAVLLDQHAIAGLGNIYVDEVLFRARIHPERMAGTLKKVELDRLFEAIRTILQRSVELGGSSVKSYVNGYGATGGYQNELVVYGKQGNPCPTCGALIVKIRVAGRGTHFCEQCQKRPRS